MSKPVKIKVDLVLSPTLIDRLMHAVDMFEPFKRIGDMRKMTLYREKFEGFNPLVVIESILRSSKQSKTEVFFIGFPEILDAPVFLEPGISVLSSGKKWWMFEEMLDSWGYDTVTDEHRRVLAAENRIQQLNPKE